MCGGKKEEKKAAEDPPLPEPPTTEASPPAPEEPVPTEGPKGAKSGAAKGDQSSMCKASDTIIQKNTADKSLVFQSMVGGKKATGNLTQGPGGGNRSMAKSMAAGGGAQQSLMLTSGRAPAAKDASQAFKAKSVKKN